MMIVVSIKVMIWEKISKPNFVKYYKFIAYHSTLCPWWCN